MKDREQDILSPEEEKSFSEVLEDESDRRFIGWGRFKSRDSGKPDEIEVKPKTKDTFQTDFSVCTEVAYWQDSKWVDAALPLRSLNSASPGLQRLWTKGWEKGFLKIGQPVRILTWLASTKKGNQQRRFILARR
jgi:hypothetical protein